MIRTSAVAYELLVALLPLAVPFGAIDAEDQSF